MEAQFETWCLSCNCEVSEDHNCPTDITNNTGFNKNDYLERLIAAVFEREVLWNSKLPYKLRGASEMKALWLEIDMYLGTSPGSSQVKWKNLRDRFVKEHAIQCSYIPSGSAAVKKKSSWPFYESLCFLSSTISYRNTTSNIKNMNPNMLSSSIKKEEPVTFASIPSTSIAKKETIYQQHNQQKDSLLKPQLLQSKQNYSRQNVKNSDTTNELTTSTSVQMRQ